jgi:hypothetical protein
MIDVTPVTASAGAPVTVTGQGFPAAVPVQLYIESPLQATGLLTTTVADGTGVFTATLTLPLQWPTGEPFDAGTVQIVATVPDATVEARVPLVVASLP